MVSNSPAFWTPAGKRKKKQELLWAQCSSYSSLSPYFLTLESSSYFEHLHLEASHIESLQQTKGTLHIFFWNIKETLHDLKNVVVYTKENGLYLVSNYNPRWRLTIDQNNYLYYISSGFRTSETIKEEHWICTKIMTRIV